MCLSVMTPLAQVAGGDKGSLPIVTTLDSVDEILGVGKIVCCADHMTVI